MDHMDITQENFEEHFTSICEAINGATFIAFDAEFTGLYDGDKDYISRFDTPEERYSKLLQPAKDYIIIQFGLCTFRKLPVFINKYEVKPFSFYLCPQKSEFRTDVSFKCHESSMEFIASKGLDFDKALTKGISYITMEEEKKLRKNLLSKHNSQMARLVNEKPEKEADKIEDRWLREFLGRQIAKIKSCMLSESGSVELEPCNSDTEKILYKQLNAKFPQKLFLETFTNEDSLLTVKVTIVKCLEQKKEFLAQKQDDELKELDKAYGFTRIFKLLHESGKLIIGHNVLLDLMHIIHQFWQTLPSDYKLFKDSAHAAFPKLIDTKHMASRIPFRKLSNNTSLELLFHDLRTSRKIPNTFSTEISEGFPDFTQENHYHTASFDAYVTGMCFLYMKSYLEIVKKGMTMTDKLEQYENRVYLSNMDDVYFINLNGDDLPLSRDHMFHVQMFDGKMESDLKSLLQPFCKFMMKSLGDDSVLVRFPITAKHDDAIQSLTCKDSGFVVQSFLEWHTGGRQSKPERKRKLFSNDITKNEEIPAKRKLKQPMAKISTINDKKQEADAPKEVQMLFPIDLDNMVWDFDKLPE